MDEKVEEKWEEREKDTKHTNTNIQKDLYILLRLILFIYSSANFSIVITILSFSNPTFHIDDSSV